MRWEDQLDAHGEAVVHALWGRQEAVDPIELVRRDGWHVSVGGPGDAVLATDGALFVPASLRRERAGFACLVCVATAALGRVPSRTGARRLASAILLPRERFERDIDAVGWDLHALKARHPHASHEAIARRIVELRGGSVQVVDQGPIARRWSVGSGRQVVGRALIADRDWRRVLTLSCA